MADYTNQSMQRVLKAISALAGKELDGVSPGQVAQLTSMTASQVTATLANLEKAGWAERTPSGMWRLTPAPVRVFAKVAENFEQARLKVMKMEAYYLNGN